MVHSYIIAWTVDFSRQINLYDIFYIYICMLADGKQVLIDFAVFLYFHVEAQKFHEVISKGSGRKFHIKIGIIQ